MVDIEYLEVDDDVNVYVCGDLHGCYSLLMHKLKEINFNFNTDLLICVGDLVDRGKENEKCVGLLNESWFKSIKGNHEDFCYKGMMDDSVKFYHRMPNNGGSWFYNLPESTMEHIGRRLNQLPILLEVSYLGNKIGFVHADLPVEDWEMTKELLINDDQWLGRSIKDCLLWSRDIITRGEPVNIAKIDHVFLGHTVLEEVTTLGNCTFLDTGAVFKGEVNSYDLSVINLKEFILYTLDYYCK